MNSLKIDMYQASMLRAWFFHNLHNQKSVMEVFCRKLPTNRNFLVNVGINRIIEHLSTIKFDEREIQVLKSLEFLHVDDAFCDYLRNVNFAKELKVYAMREGEVCFSNQPLIRIEGPIGLVQYVEKLVLSIINHDVRIASKSIRVVIAAKGKTVNELGGRRAHESVTSDTARTTYITGFAGTSSVEAYDEYGVPCHGTQGHVWIMSFPSEEQAQKAWHEVYPESTYLTDTYNSRRGTEIAIDCTHGNKLGGIRLDSGDLAEQSATFRRLMTNADHFDAKIAASNDLDEYLIQDLESRGAPIDSYGVGTQVVSTPDAPTCGFVYKLVHIEGRDICKIASGGKDTWPARKQIWRHYMEYNGIKHFTHDKIDLENSEQPFMSEPLLLNMPLNATGSKEERVRLTKEAREYCASRMKAIPGHLKVISNKPILVEYPIEFSEKLIDIKNNIQKNKK